jgi:hypothetical protein
VSKEEQEIQQRQEKALEKLKEAFARKKAELEELKRVAIEVNMFTSSFITSLTLLVERRLS